MFVIAFSSCCLSVVISYSCFLAGWPIRIFGINKKIIKTKNNKIKTKQNCCNSWQCLNYLGIHLCIYLFKTLVLSLSCAARTNKVNDEWLMAHSKNLHLYTGGGRWMVFHLLTRRLTTVTTLRTQKAWSNQQTSDWSDNFNLSHLCPHLQWCLVLSCLQWINFNPVQLNSV